MCPRMCAAPATRSPGPAISNAGEVDRPIDVGWAARQFQRDFNFADDGLIAPGGPTERTLERVIRPAIFTRDAQRDGGIQPAAETHESATDVGGALQTRCVMAALRRAVKAAGRDGDRAVIRRIMAGNSQPRAPRT